MNRSSSIAYIDTLTNLMLIFFLLFMLFQMQMMSQKQSTEMKAEVVVEMEWHPKSTDDIDLWLLMPGGDMVGFNRQDKGVAVLDRDDRGVFGDTFTTPDGTVVPIEINKEVMSVRALLPGRYVVNAHFYAHLRIDGLHDERGATPQEISYKVTDINPVFKEVASGKKTLSVVGQQVTLLSFELTSEGQVININMEDDHPFIPVVTGAGAGLPPPSPGHP